MSELEVRSQPISHESPGLRDVADKPRLAVLLDYDGTLVPYTDRPSLAVPDRALRRLLRDLVTRGRADVHIVSGRDGETLATWFGDLPVALHAEHGATWRAPGGAWTAPLATLGALRAFVRDVMIGFSHRTPGSFIEGKPSALTWHYRQVEPAQGEATARELSEFLDAALDGTSAEVLAGSKAVTVRPTGVHKGLALARLGRRASVLALGDDRADDDLFGALPLDALGVAVGHGPRRAAWRVAGVGAARRLLERIVTLRSERGPAW